MATRQLPPLEFLRECFAYDPDEGVVRWRVRPLSHFEVRAKGMTWNTRYAGTTGVLDEYGYYIFRLQHEGKIYRVPAHAIGYALSHNTVDFPEIDHRNTAEGDNRLDNLRPATRGQNNANRPGWAKTGMPKGVTRRPSGRYMANCQSKGRTVHLGTFDSASEAHAAYCDYAKSLHGDFFNAGPAHKALVIDWYEPLDVPDLP